MGGGGNRVAGGRSHRRRVVLLAVQRGTMSYLLEPEKEGANESYKHQSGKVLLLGMELLVEFAEPTYEN